MKENEKSVETKADLKTLREKELDQELTDCDIIHEEIEAQYHTTGLTYIEPKTENLHD
ncbi:hypothetical protein ACFO25_03150 [Paenactinomyces guangxiensis]|uniref:Uncharacterized protein n=1 Tax=Paenactinomyces guangxiensis TaxID=1490290 RepID=A0A7W2A9Y3_9BACL|nr:hypothetical protein [Paenactinomyces guangxiensis]MBA4495677.1 hypothetical protein [Paenactinomyces guangxiensis]MBH8592665.1 hypothetical protein [Paenactinomyces guangxiensis]